MVTTPRPVLRDRILKVLLQNQGRALTRKQVLDRLRSQHETAWTEEDVASPAGRPSESKWENNASFERADMVREGLLEAGGDGHWVLTSQGMRQAQQLTKQLTLIDELSIDNRGYANLRAGQMMLDTDSETSAAEDSQEAATLEQIDDVPFEALAAAVSLEKANAFGYGIGNIDATTAVRQEAQLVQRFVAYLEDCGHQVGRFRIQPPGESTSLYTDIFDVTDGCLYEAKASSTREAVRMAIGQLLDYSRHISPPPRLAILLPGLPTSDLLALLKLYKIVCVSDAGSEGFKMATNE